MSSGNTYKLIQLTPPSYRKRHQKYNVRFEDNYGKSNIQTHKSKPEKKFQAYGVHEDHIYCDVHIDVYKENSVPETECLSYTNPLGNRHILSELRTGPSSEEVKEIAASFVEAILAGAVAKFAEERQAIPGNDWTSNQVQEAKENANRAMIRHRCIMKHLAKTSKDGRQCGINRSRVQTISRTKSLKSFKRLPNTSRDIEFIPLTEQLPKSKEKLAFPSNKVRTLSTICTLL